MKLRNAQNKDWKIYLSNEKSSKNKEIFLKKKETENSIDSVVLQKKIL